MSDGTYMQPIDPSEFKRPAVIVSRLIPQGASVLEIGCAGGRVSRLFKAKGCRVVGVEIDRERAAAARSVCDEVVEADVEQPGVVEALPEGFDAIVCADVLEHMRRPEEVLKRLSGRLAPSGRIYAAIPNLLVWRVRLQLLMGDFHYETAGIFDETHLRFYSYRSAVQLCESAGLRVEREAFPWDIPLGNRIGASYRRSPGPFSTWVVRLCERIANRWPGLLAPHFIFVLKPAGQP